MCITGFPCGTSGKESACQCRRCKRHKFNPWVGKILWSRKWQHTPVFLPGKFHGQRYLAGYIAYGVSNCWTRLRTRAQREINFIVSLWSKVAIQLGARCPQKMGDRGAICLDMFIFKEMGPSLWERHFWVIKLTKDLSCSRKDLPMFQREEKLLTTLGFLK